MKTVSYALFILRSRIRTEVRYCSNADSVYCSMALNLKSE